ncbi:MAG: hypothetical protein IJV40_00995 [Oscillospiraceae bacterium]|nr:hypothetical protein [Oscillospiraceae bacterium]
MKRDKWDPETAEPQEYLTDDAAEPDADAESMEFSLEDILFEFSGGGRAGVEEPEEEEALFDSDKEYEFHIDPDEGKAATAEPDLDKPESGGEAAFALYRDETPAASREEPEAEEAEEAPEEPEEYTDSWYEEEPEQAASLPEEELPPPEAEEPAGEPEEPAGAEPEEEPEQPSRGRRWPLHARKHKVWEEFPDSSAEEDLSAQSGEDTVDYSALFRMFADPVEEETGNPAADRPAVDSPAERESPRREAGETGGAHEPKMEPAPEEEQPLFAENPLDFRDILREFMLGDQHPIYDDTPGIGSRPDSASLIDSGLDDLDDMLRGVINNVPESKSRTGEAPQKEEEPEAPKAEETEEAPETPKPGKPARSALADAGLAKWKERWGRPRQKKEPKEAKAVKEPGETGKPKEYTVEEDFPLDRAENPEPAEAPEQTGDGRQNEAGWNSLPDLDSIVVPGTAPALDPAAPPHREEPSPEEETAEETEEEPEGGISKLMRRFGVRSGNSKKRALNEPKAYAGFEDYVPQEEAPKPAETAPASAGEAQSAEAAPEAPEARIPTPSQEELDDEILYSGDFPSFGQWILNELMTLWIRLNGIGDRESTATMEDDAEDLGREVNVANASRYYGSQVTMLRMRFQIGLVLLAILAYITLGFPLSGMLKTAKVASAMCLGLQLTIMLLCLDIVTNAAVNLVRRRFGADALAVLACVISSFDALSVAVGGFGNPHIPLCLFSSLALMGVLFSALLSARGLRKATRVPAIGKRVYCVTAEEGVRGGGDLTLLKSVRPSAGFVRRAEEAPPDEALFNRTALIQLLAAIVLSLLTAVVKHSVGDMLYILSAILSCAVPVTALLAFALPFFIGSERIFSSGAAVAGWSGIHDIGCSRNLIVTDRDLFPEETIAIETVRIFADDSAERVIGFAGTMIAASGSGLAPCFAELMEKNNCRMRQVEDFQWLSGGGLQGRIEGSTVLCGSSDLMQLMNVKVPYRLVDRTTVLLAIDGVLYGIFKINYTGLPEIRTALQELIASNRHPIFAIRDFNITPEMLHEVFDVATDGYDFPPYGDRFRISEAKPSETSKVSAVICREGLGPLTHLADTGRSMYVAIRLNLMITALVAVLGMLLVFVKLIGTGEVSAWLPFVLMLLDAVMVTLISLFMRF